MAEPHPTLTAALTHLEAGRLRDAERTYRQLLAADPRSFVAWNGLGSTLKQQEQLDEAVVCFHRALELKPEYVEAHNNLGNALAEQGQWDAALTSYRQALKWAPDDAEVRWNQSMAMLVLGDFANGWTEFEYGRLTGKLPQQRFPQPSWQGETLAGKTILLHAEQGLGDAIQFVRYAALVKRLAAKVVVGCHRPLTQLFSTCAGIDELVGSGDQIPSFDVHSPFLSLPRIFETRLDTIPADVPYLAANPTLVAAWREAMKDIPGFRIGINWRGREGQGHFRKRDIPLEHFVSLQTLAGIQLVRLQKSISPEEVAKFSNQLQIFSPGDDFDGSRGAFTDTAAIMQNLDLVITSDTAVAHLAGALGVPVWLALPYAPDWRWLLHRSDSPWYPTMRLFRQKSPNDWHTVFDEIKTALQDRLCSPRPSS